MLRTPHIVTSWDAEMADLIADEAMAIRAQLYNQEADILDFQMWELKNGPSNLHEDDPEPWIDLTRYYPQDSDDPDQWDLVKYGFTSDTRPRGYKELDLHLTKRGCRFMMYVHGFLSGQKDPRDTPTVEPEHQLMLARLWTTHLIMVHGVQARHLYGQSYPDYDPAQFERRFDSFYNAHNLKLDMRI